jgi:hypothetical protein
MGHEKLDYLTRMHTRELVLMGLVAVAALIANLACVYVVERRGIEPKLLITGADPAGRHADRACAAPHAPPNYCILVQYER